MHVAYSAKMFDNTLIYTTEPIILYTTMMTTKKLGPDLHTYNLDFLC